MIESIPGVNPLKLEVMVEMSPAFARAISRNFMEWAEYEGRAVSDMKGGRWSNAEIQAIVERGRGASISEAEFDQLLEDSRWLTYEGDDLITHHLEKIVTLLTSIEAILKEHSHDNA